MNRPAGHPSATIAGDGATIEHQQKKTPRKSSADLTSGPRDWLTAIERAYSAVSPQTDIPELNRVLIAEVSRLLAPGTTVRFAPGDDPSSEDLKGGTIVPVRATRVHLGSLVISGTISHEELRAVRLISSIAGQIAVRTLHDQRLRVAQRHERNAVAIYQAARDLASISDVDVVLDTIVRRAHEFTGADVAYVALQDPGSEAFVHHASSGTRTEDFNAVRVSGLTGLMHLAAVERQVIISNDFFRDPRRNMALDRYLRAEGLLSVVCAPMHMADQFIGALFVSNRRADSFSDADVDLLAALGAIAAGAIVNARLHEEERHRLSELREMNAVVASQHAQLEKWVRTHQRLTRMVLDGHSLPRIAKTISQVVANPVAVLDRFGILRTFADPKSGEADNAGTSGLASDVETAIRTQLEHLRTVADFKVGDGEVPGLVVPVMTRGGLLGYLAILELHRPLDGQMRMFVQQAATVVAIEMMQERVAAEVETRLKGDLLSELTSGPGVDPVEVRRRAGLLGYDLSGDLRVVVVHAEPIGATPPADPNVLAGRLSAAVCDVLACGTRASLMAVKQSRAVALLIRPERENGGASDAVPDLQARISERLGHPVSVIASSWVHDPADVSAAYADVVKCMNALFASGRTGFAVDFETSLLERIVVEVARSPEAKTLVKDVLGPIIAYDARHSSNLVESLEQYLLADSALETASRRLNVHPHTLRYRLGRIEQIARRSMADPGTKLEFQLALRLYRSLSE